MWADGNAVGWLRARFLRLIKWVPAYQMNIIICGRRDSYRTGGGCGKEQGLTVHCESVANGKVVWTVGNERLLGQVYVEGGCGFEAIAGCLAPRRPS